MTWLEWIGAATLVIFTPLGAGLAFCLGLEMWVRCRDLRKAVLGYYWDKLKRESSAKSHGA